MKENHESPEMTANAKSSEKVTPRNSAAKTLRIVGLTLLVVATVPIVAAATVILGEFSAEATDAATVVANVTFPLFLASVGLVAAGSLAELLAWRRWPSAGGVSAQFAGAVLVSVGVLALVGGMIVAAMAGESGDAQARRPAIQVAWSGVVEGGAGTLLLIGGTWVEKRTLRPAFAAADVAVGLITIVTVAVLLNPGVVSVKVASVGELAEAAAMAAEREASILDAPTRILYFNGTLTASVRVPVVGVGQHAPGSVHEYAFQVQNESDRYVVLELNWNKTKIDHLRLLLERYANDQWTLVSSPTQTAPLRHVTPLETGEYRTRVFVGDEGDSVMDLRFEERLSIFAYSPPNDYRSFSE